MQVLKLWALLALAAGGPSLIASGRAEAAFDMLSFRSPTGNIHCVLGKIGHDGFATCEIQEFQPSYTRRPVDCDLDWGSSFSVGASGRGELACHGDTLRSGEAVVLSYGKSLELFGIRCRSEKTGITCQNVEGGGFAVGRARQRVY